MKGKISAILICLLCALLLAGCGILPTLVETSTTSPIITEQTTVPSGPTTTTTLTVVVYGRTYCVQETDLWGFLDENGDPVTEAIYTVCDELATDRYFVRDAEGNDFITDSTGQIIMPFFYGDYHGNICSTQVFQENENVPVRFFSNGGIYDQDGVLLSDIYDELRCNTGETVVALCDEGCFLLDLDGNRLERLDMISDYEKLPVGGYVKLQKRGFYFDTYGVRSADSHILLPVLYQEVMPLSTDRIVGSKTRRVLETGDPETHAVIVDGDGNTVCDQYNDIYFPQREDGSYSPYGVAWISNPEAWKPGGVYTSESSIPSCYYYVIDWDGNAQFNEEIIGCTHEGNLECILTFQNGETARCSLLTGEILP